MKSNEEIEQILKTVKVEKLPNDEGYFASIPACRGVWGYGETAEISRADVAEVLNSFNISGLLEEGVDVQQLIKAGNLKRVDEAIEVKNDEGTRRDNYQVD